MSIVNDVITDAYIASGLYSVADPLDANLTNYGLRILNRMLDGWTSEIAPMFNVVDSNDAINPTPGFTLVPGQSLYTLGPSNLVGVRPPQIVDIFLRDGNSVDYYITPIGVDEFTRLIYKVAPGRPDRAYVNYNATTIQLTFYPTPAYTDQAHILYDQSLAPFPNTSQTIALPPGWEQAMVSNLAVRLASAFGKQAPPEVVAAASWSKSAVALQSETKYLLQNQMPTMKRRFFNILTGGTV